MRSYSKITFIDKKNKEQYKLKWLGHTRVKDGSKIKDKGVKYIWKAKEGQTIEKMVRDY